MKLSLQQAPKQELKLELRQTIPLSVLLDYYTAMVERDSKKLDKYIELGLTLDSFLDGSWIPFAVDYYCGGGIIDK